jgi:hypothetical protein
LGGVNVLDGGALAFAGVGYVERSSDDALAEFMTAASASGPSKPVQQGPTGCSVGKKKLPTQIVPSL